MDNGQALQRRIFRDNEFAVQISGDGIPFILGHCLLGCMEADNAIQLLNFEQLARCSQLIRFDARGHGESAGSDIPRDYCWAQQALDIWAIADHYIPGKRVILGGFSMGSATALHAALLRREQVAALVLVLPPTAWHSRPLQAKKYRRLASMIGWIAGASKLLLKLTQLSPKGKSARRALALAVSEHISRAQPGYLRAALQGAAKSDLPNLGDLQRLDIPTAILTWTDDEAHPVSTGKTLESVMPDVRVYQVSSPDDVANWTDYIEDMLHTLN
ncbi:MAG: alpha/beta fold hydrolase [Pseudomonadales bacterium]